jgi:copper(I)-binding protein
MTSLDTARTPVTIMLLVAVIGLVAVGGCSASDQGSAATELTVIDPWTRPTAPGAESTAFYAVVENQTGADDRLVGADSPACGMTMLHSSVNTDGVMSMRPADPQELVVAAGDRLALEPGGLHVMCMGLTEPVEDGDLVSMTLEFERAGSMVVEARAERR